MDDQFELLQQKLLLTLRIIVVALAVGSLAFLVTAAFLARQGIVPGRRDPLFGYVVVAAAALAILARLVVGHVLTRAGRRRIVENRFVAPLAADPTVREFAQQSDRAKLFLVYFSQNIPTAAILEAAAFFATIVYLVLDRSPWNLAVAAGLIGLILVQFPTRGHVDEWIDRQLRQVTDERQFRA